ncbi:rhodanese-like domain-containing protein [Chitinilyticum piscinae]|uniref:Rhodanese-like domain-containing protein n=1 Tax=Chitinilyticum piscinae TaxID=2866724 RepID=A0A8J7FX79_9NEIS|nr:rhodanese-like domain-containing protein [Chitinilyticum piscinae]MBE9608315.1 rhodanese-like domain-containing protein [Chitinilyticum piscinae]
MKQWLLALILFGAASLAGAAPWQYRGEAVAVLIDVRTPEEFAAGHIDDAINIPLDRIVSGVTELRGLGKDSRILLYCRSGRRSAEAALRLNAAGYRQILDGGAMTTLQSQLQRQAHP